MCCNVTTVRTVQARLSDWGGGQLYFNKDDFWGLQFGDFRVEVSGMQKSIELSTPRGILRGMEHIPDEVAGAVPAVVLFHGYTANKLQEHRLFLKVSRALEALGIACFRYDFYGSGESDGNFEEMTLDTEMEDANAILDSVRHDSRVNPSRVTLLGLSMGGLVASLLAGDRPSDVAKLVLLAPAGNMEQLIWGMLERNRVPDTQETMDNGGNLVGRGFALSLKGLKVFERSKNFTGPVLLVHGREDEAVTYQVSYQYKEYAYGDRAQIVLLPGADHTFNATPWEQEVIQRVRGFISLRV